MKTILYTLLLSFFSVSVSCAKEEKEPSEKKNEKPDKEHIEKVPEPKIPPFVPPPILGPPPRICDNKDITNVPAAPVAPFWAIGVVAGAYVLKNRRRKSN